ncbi:MAG TPA: hypothetical protein VG166_09145 [Caulobacteraceae bacterium]|jgi:hypothetical protein|nr:hypothetical protein [Caulobacteraceae bacterium]
MATVGKTARAAEPANLGTSAAGIGDDLFIDTVQPAWPQSKPVVLVGGLDDRLLLQEGFAMTGKTAAEDI